MDEQPYDQLSDVDLLALCCWREARGEPFEAKLAQCWSVRNRVEKPSWWGNSYSTVILKPWQYSSFNANDPNATKWPHDSPDWLDCQQAASQVLNGEVPDPTNGATNYYDTSITFPRAWGNENEWENTLNIGRLKFWKMGSAPLGVDESTQV